MLDDFLNIITYPFKPISNDKQNLHLIDISERLKRGGHSVKLAHRTDFYIIQFVTAGQSTHMVDFQEIEIKTGDVLILNPGQVHAFRPAAEYEGLLLAFSADFFRQNKQGISFLENSSLYNNFNLVTKLGFNTAEFTDLLSLTSRIEVELKKEPDQFQQFILHNYLSTLLFICERNLKEVEGLQLNAYSHDLQYISSFRKLIQQHFRAHVKVKDYALELAISERKLQKICEVILGKTPKQLIIDYLIIESKRFLLHETSIIKEIAYYLGFDEPSNFTKFFKSQVGTTPSQFKESHLALFH